MFHAAPSYLPTCICTAYDELHKVLNVVDNIASDTKITSSDANVTFHVSGAVTQSCIRSLRRLSCDDRPILIIEYHTETLDLLMWTSTQWPISYVVNNLHFLMKLTAADSNHALT